MRWRDAINASSRLASFRVEGRGSRVLPQSSWRVYRCIRDTQFNSRQPSGLNERLIDRETFSSSVYTGFVLALSFHHKNLEPDCVDVWTRGAYVRDKITSARLSSKMQGEAYVQGGTYLQDTTVFRSIFFLWGMWFTDCSCIFKYSPCTFSCTKLMYPCINTCI